jgi:hypothetical protein
MPDPDVRPDSGAPDVVREPTIRERLPDAVTSALETAVESAVGVAGDALQVAGHVVEAAGRRWRERPGQRVRRVRRMGRYPLRNLYDRYPEARRASPRELGLQAIGVDEIVGTAVAGATQRGGDFLPLRPFRSGNWIGRWQRIRKAIDRLATLPPIDVVRYDGGYWVTDGHNRVAAALYGGQVAIDAMVTELIPPGGRSTQRPGPIAPAVLESRALRSAASGAPPLGDVTLDERTGGPLAADEPPREDGGTDDGPGSSDRP